MFNILTGIKDFTYIDAPFTRMHQSIQNYPTDHSETGDVPLYQTDEWERNKPFKPKRENIVGTTTPIPMDDNDEKLHFYDI